MLSKKERNNTCPDEQITQHMRTGLRPCPFGTLLPFGRNVVYAGNVRLHFAWLL
jgi:hypothetical protein